MSSAPIKSLTIRHLRGSVRPFALSFEKGKKLTLVYGENGTGKSTICDALDFIGNGKVGSLENRGLGKTMPYWHSLGKRPSDLSVTLESSNGECTASLVKADVVANPPQERPSVKVLRRATIVSLIQARGADRYAEIRRFVDVSGVESSESALRNLIKEIEGVRDQALTRVQENRQTIQQFWEEAGQPAGNALTWAAEESKRKDSTWEAEAESVSNLRQLYESLVPYPDRLRAAQEELAGAQESLSQANTALGESISKAIEDPSVVAILEAAQAHIAGHPDLPVCPLCESAERLEGLSERVGQRLAALSALRNAQTLRGSSQKNVEAVVSRVDATRREAFEQALKFDACKHDGSLPSDLQLPHAPPPSELEDWGAWLASTSELPAGWRQAEALRIDKKQFVSTLKRAVDTLDENTLALVELDAVIPRLKRALEIVEEERHAFTDSALSSIAAEVGRLYEEVNPGEGLNKISLQLDPKQRASLNIGASFEGLTDAPPPAYFSDSHLDTLGLCVFLALAALECPDETILVLDDVLGSVDEPHVDRLVEMLYSEATKFRHCMITTHYRPWKQKLRWGWLKNGQCQFLELTKWTPADGLTLIRSLPDADRLRALLAESPPDAQLVCSKAGVILEAALDFITQLYECSVPRRQNGLYTLGDLLPSVDKQLRQALRVDVLDGNQKSDPATYITRSLTTILDELERIAQVRNVFGAHFNEISFELLDSDAITFGELVLDLISILTDSGVGWPRNGKSGQYWSTTGETRRLYPYAKPS